MNIFPTNIQYFLLKHFKNKKEIILLYTDPDYTNEKLLGYYYPEKMILENCYLYRLNDVIKYGNIRLIKWLKANGCSWDEKTFSDAAYFGKLKIMIFLFENGCPWYEYTFSSAAFCGNLENMKWLKENGCPWNCLTFTRAIQNGNLENIQWLKANGCPQFET
jgi:hypothetical protein